MNTKTTKKLTVMFVDFGITITLRPKEKSMIISQTQIIYNFNEKFWSFYKNLQSV